MFSDGFGDFILGLGQVQKFGNVCNIDMFDARRAMTAVNAMPLPTDFGEAREGQRVIFFLCGSVFVGDGLIELLDGMRTRQNYSDARTAQRIVNALIWRQSDSGG